MISSRSAFDSLSYPFPTTSGATPKFSNATSGSYISIELIINGQNNMVIKENFRRNTIAGYGCPKKTN